MRISLWQVASVNFVNKLSSSAAWSVGCSYPAVEGPRPTKDVDLILEDSTAGQFSEMGATLRSLGFREDTSEDAPICRYLLPSAAPTGGDLPVDFMPLNGRVLGFSNPWYPGAYSAPQSISSSAGQLRIIDAPTSKAVAKVTIVTMTWGTFSSS